MCDLLPDINVRNHIYVCQGGSSGNTKGTSRCKRQETKVRLLLGFDANLGKIARSLKGAVIMLQ